ncbi:MAG: TRAP transporter substrate-binding protein DctP [Thermoanaerobaculaceae bacterium]|nr:TRAP transporter substrate-binding protein DctP [Thermoanaerobaculaceae bacterium]
MVGARMVAVAGVLAALADLPARAEVFKVATLAPEGSVWMEGVRRGAAEVARRSGGRVSFRFFPGGTMGNDQSVLRKIRIGQLQGGALTAGGLAAVWPDAQIYSMPFLFHSYAEVDAVRAQLDERLLAGLFERGFVSFGLVEGGFAYLLSTRPVRSFADLAGRRPWVPEGDVVGQAIFAAAGVSPVALPMADVLTGLQTGLIDTVASTPVGAVALQWFTKTKYLTDSPLIYVYGTLVLDRTAFERLAAEDRAVVHEVLAGVMRELDRRTRADNEAARRALLEQGLEAVTVTPEAAKQWEVVAAKATATLAAQGAFSATLYAELQQAIATFRAAATAAPP